MSDFLDKNLLSDFDIFFYYGKSDLEIETKSDLMANLMQPKRSLFYNRALDATGIHDYENFPEGPRIRVNLPYDIVNSFGKRNQFVSSGENGTRDRRVAVSQSTVKVEFSGKGNVNVTVLYIPLANFKQTESLQIGLNAGKK